MLLFSRPRNAVIGIATFLFFGMAGFAQMPVVDFTVQGATSGCAPLTVQFINQSVNGQTYFWDFGNGNTSALMNPVTVYLQPGNFTVKLVVTSAGGQQDSVIKTNYISTGTVPVVQFSASPVAVCEGGTITFQNHSQNFTSCLWDFGDGTTSTSVSPTHTYTLAGQFTVTLVVQNQPGGCSSTLTRSQYITVYPKPVTQFTASPLSSCHASQPVVFNSTSMNAANYHWNFGNGQTSGLQNPSHVYGTAGQFTVTLITTSPNGCKDTLVKSNYIQILDNPVPVITPSATSGCTPQAISFSTTASNVSSYLWDFGSAGTSNLAAPVKHFGTAGSYPVTLTVQYQNGCSNTSSAVPVTIYPTPMANYSMTNSLGCSPLTVQFNNLTSGTGYSYLWNFGDGQTSTLQHPSHVYSGNGIYSTSLTVVSAQGCSSVYASPNQVIVNNPDATFHTDVTSGCPPLLVSFIPHSSVGGMSYQWNFGNGQTSASAQPTCLYSSTGSYYPSLTVTDANGCTSTYSLSAPITVNQAASNFITPPPVTACAPFTATFSDNSFGTVSWNWNFGDGNSSTLQNPTHTYFTPGTYTVSLNTQTAGIGCSQQIPVYRIFNIIGGKADFSFLTEKCPPYIAYFHDSSVNAASWLWDFGDGTTSTLQNPVHTYANPGTYTVSLTIVTHDGCTYPSTHNYAVNFEPLSANPVATTTDTVPPLNVQFYANSQGATGWLWNFGDGTTSTLQNPLHVFTTAPPYNITLTLSNDSCTYTLTFPNVTFGSGTVNIGNDSTVVHVPEPQSGCAPYTIHFYCPVINTTAWQWHFGDGTTSALKNPIHTYTAPGLYDITLITTDINGQTDTLFRPQSVRVNGVQGGFLLNANTTCNGNSISPVPLAAHASAYHWDFGDGSTSSLPLPQHSYANTGNNYIVSLSVTDTSGCQAFSQQSFYGIEPNSVFSDKRKVCAGDTVYFSTANQNYAYYLWNFGNGQTATTPNPAFVFTSAGNFNVTLTVSDTTGCQQTLTLPYPVEVINPVAQFAVGNSNSNCQSVYYSFINQSTGATSYLWNFGNGYVTTGFSPTCYYNSGYPGYYTVTLTAINAGCSSTYTLSNAVYIPYRDAGFSFVKSGNCIPVTVAFTDSSSDAVSWHWDFGDGNYSTLQNPVHVFQSAPVYPVRLTITDQYGCTDTISRQVLDAAFAGISIPHSTGCAPLQVSFADSSGHAVAWNWNFGNGQTSTAQNPTVTYSQNGYYTVQLTITSTYGCTSTITIDSAITVTGPQADFNTSFTSGCAPALVEFQNHSVNATSYLWCFGDSSFSNNTNATHVYHTPGNYTVSLVAFDNNGCSDTTIWNSFIEITGPVAGFSVSSTEGCAPFQLPFQNQTVNGVTYFWNFGDGDSSALENPVHIYQSAGNYIVTLIARDSTGCEDVYTYPDTIRVYEQAVASASASVTSGCHPLQVAFQSSGSNSSHLLWNFGDGNSSVHPSPVHTYNDSGYFTVSLIAYANGFCHDTAQLVVHSMLTPSADFSGDVTEGCAPLSVNFSNQSFNLSNASYLWSFSNGLTSVQCNPSVTFTQPGLYSVSLLVTNDGGCADSIQKTAYILVYDTVPPAAPQLLAASVENDSTVQLTWMNVADPDIWAYHLYRLDNQNGNWNLVYSIIDTNGVSMNVTQSYTDTGLNTLHEPYSYRLQAEDRCGNINVFDQLKTHTTINITSQEQGTGIVVQWTPYQGCHFNQYELQRKETGSSTWATIAHLSSADTAYFDNTGLCPGIYHYRVRALQLCGSALSARSDTSAAGSTALESHFVDVVFVTVVDDQYVSLEWEAPAAYPDRVTGYEIYRSTDKYSYTLMATVGNNVLRYDDHNTEVDKQNYYYLIIPLNDCDLAADTGMIGSSILLQSEMDPQTESVKLKWTPYEQWKDGVKEYIIQRKEGNHPWETIRTVGGNRTETVD